ncbi:MAG TPA: hypothetical protein VMC09_10490 [Anaerolineales bacterium]|nr:hypothetical protein [Anaerolineales bacterium]
MSETTKRPSLFRRLLTLFGWSRSSSVLLGGFFLICGLIAYIWWPLAQEAMVYIDWHGAWWRYMDWLLLGIFTFMSLTIMARADLRRDALIVFVGALGGLVIESWGTQTNLWHYFTVERPPLWIIPAWPIASLSIDRITRLLDWGIKKYTRKAAPGKTPERSLSLAFKILYWVIFVGFSVLMLFFVAPTFNKSYTLLAMLLCALLIATPTDYRYAVLTFVAGSALGYYLELWGTTRQCWTYYTNQTPPFFAVLAHGMAAVAFWRAGLMVRLVWGKLLSRVRIRPGNASTPGD